MKKLFALFVAMFSLALVSCGQRGDVTIVYTNDVHTYIDNAKKDSRKSALSYGNVAALKQDLLAQGKNVALVDAGDFIQGTVFGSMDQGANVVKFMNAAGYDLAVFGNHEFDYGMDRTLDVIKEAAFPLVACNFVHAKDNKPVVAPYKILRLGKSRVAFVGIMTPDTYSKTSPKHFMDKDGKTFLYKIYGCDDSEELYSSVQKAVDQAARKADDVVALGHLGVDESSAPWRSEDVIARTHGIDAFIDGHSHTVMEQKFVKNDKGQDVLLTQTGCYFGAIGLVELNGGQMSSRLIKDYKPSDAKVDSLVSDWMAQVDKHMGTKIATCDFPLCANSPVGNHERLVRKQESNLGDFVSDAFYWHFNFVEGLDCDIALANGGGLRSDIPAGDVTYSAVKTVLPFGNDVCLVELTGRQLFDALEFGARFVGLGDNGGFMHAAGLRYKIDATIPTAVETNSEKLWLSSPGPYRVSDVQVYDKKSAAYVPLDMEKRYAVAGLSFTLREMGDGFAMFEGVKVVKNYAGEDFIIAANYAKAFAKGTDANALPKISSQSCPLASYKNYLLNYEKPEGAGRIEIKK
ncbi:MAG: bifunctional metallophosphatase/5'-nucleotidase [Treponema sp.]|nr:bifunctional metallophosphatase/5'-nucleotidase [Treponema sp.]